jgi:hypothetical protein
LRGMEANGVEPSMPDNPAPYLTRWLLEIGPSVPAGMGEGVIGWQDMAAWERLTGVELSPWEARTLRRMSQAFVNQRSDARKANCPEPFAEPEAVAKRIDQQFAAMFKAFAKAKPEA